MNNKQKRVAVINDISGFGKCSLTVALPIISATGVETCIIPTALLSTHTGGIDGFTYNDLKDDILPIAKHWSKLGIKFDAIYSGFLGSFEQIEIVSEVFDILADDNTLIVVDPCMADDGKLYKTYTPEMAKGVVNLCKKADIIVPNLTESSILLDIPYEPEKINEDEIKNILQKLCKLGCKQAVITGLSLYKEKLGVAYYDSITNMYGCEVTQKIGGSYHGTGDIFASTLVGCLLNDIKLLDAIKIAMNFTSAAIKRTYNLKTDTRYGVDFEHEIHTLIRNIEDVC